jgi:hypothetical protein
VKIRSISVCMLELNVLLCFLLPSAFAQQPIPLQNVDPQATTAASASPRMGSGSSSTAKHFEVELVDVRDKVAFPSTLHRPVGPFILMLVNRSRDVHAAFVLDPAAVDEGVVSPNPSLRLAEAAAATSHHRLAGLVDLPAGTYHLKSVASGKTLCSLTIE